MAHVELTPEMLVVRMEGADKLWALKGELHIPREHVIGSSSATAEAGEWYHGMELGGTSLHGVITAGRSFEHGEVVFWDVRHADKAIAIHLRGERYDRLVIEVDDPAATIAAIGAPQPRW